MENVNDDEESDGVMEIGSGGKERDGVVKSEHDDEMEIASAGQKEIVRDDERTNDAEMEMACVE